MSKVLRTLLLICSLALPALIAPSVAAQEAKSHRLVIQVSSDAPETMNVALGNAMNAKKFYDAKGETLTVEIVTYGEKGVCHRAMYSVSPFVIARCIRAIHGLPACAAKAASARRRPGQAGQ